MSDPGKAVFLSYASQDAEAAKRICDALRAAGVEVWFDAEGGLEHGDEWDAKIRRQIKECVLFLPVISANTQAREEGYFRIEWELAAQRALGIASGVAFILPIVIDDTREPDALVPDRFRTVQWTRLRGGELTPEVKTRFLKLWSHRAGVVRHQSGVGASLDDARGRAQGAPLQSKPGWKIYAGFAAAVFALAAGAIWWLGREKTMPPVATTPVPTAPSLPNVVSGSRLLVAKAYDLLRGLDATREDFALAEEYCQRALKLDPDDGEVWAAYSQVNAAFAYRGWDNSPARKEQTRVMAERAIRLAPNSADARMAQAGAWAAFGINRDEREKLLRDILREEPDNQGVLRFLAVTVLAKPNGIEECLALNERSAALPGGDPLALFNNARYLWNNGQPAKGYEVLQRALAQKAFTSGLVLKMAMEVTWRGDFAAAAATLQQIPPTALQEDRANYHAGLLRYYQGNAAAAREIWSAFPRDYYVDFIFEGPKGLLLGLAAELDQRDAAAKVEWRAALQLVEKKIAAAPSKPASYYCQAYLLACLGEKAAAAEALRTHEQLAGIKYTPAQPMTLSLAKVYVRLGRLDEVFAYPPSGGNGILRLSPDFEALRADPRFASLMAAPGRADPAMVVAARDWPKHPDLKKAVALLDGLELIPEDFRLAEEIAQRVLDRNPTDPEAVTAMARVHSMWLLRGWDRSTARYQKAKAAAERAIQLAPDEPEAYSALAIHLYARGAEPQRALELAQRAVDLCPLEPRFHRMRDNCLWVANVPAGSVFADLAVEQENEGLQKALAAARRTVELFPKDPLVRYELSRHYRDIGRWADFERVNEEVLALAPLANAFVWKARARFGLHGDLPGMKAVLDQVPARVRGIERTVYAYFLYAAFTGRPAEGLEALNSMTESWMIDFDYRGPKALLAAALLELGGKKELARVQYTKALDELLRARTLNAEDTQTYLNEAWMLHGLGRAGEARAALRIFNESVYRPYAISPMSTWWFQAIPANLLMGEREMALALMREAATGGLGGRNTLRSRLALDPRMAPFRDDPEIKALLAAPEAAK